MVFLLFLVPCLIAFVFGVLYFDLLRKHNELRYYYNNASKGYCNVVKQRNKLEKDNKRYKARLEKWRKGIDRLHEQYSYLYQPCD